MRLTLHKTPKNAEADLKNKLYRSRSNRVFGGVASGLSEYLNIDPILVRIIFVISTAFNGIGLLAYIIMWIVVPEEPLVATNFNSSAQSPPQDDSTKEESKDSSSENRETGNPNFDFQQQFNQKKTSSNGRLIGGSILIGIGLLLLSKSFFPFFDFVDLFPLILVGVGAGLIINSIKK